MLFLICEWMNGNYILIMFMYSYGKLYIEILLIIIKIYSKFKSFLKFSGKIYEFCCFFCNFLLRI